MDENNEKAIKNILSQAFLWRGVWFGLQRLLNRNLVVKQSQQGPRGDHAAKMNSPTCDQCGKGEAGALSSSEFCAPRRGSFYFLWSISRKKVHLPFVNCTKGGGFGVDHGGLGRGQE